MTDVMRIGSLAPWYGSKRALAPRIVAELGDHAAYYECFCGSMAVLLAKPASRMEVVNDLHGDIVNVARVVKDGALGPAFYRRMRRIVASEAECIEAQAAVKTWENEPAPAEPDLERACRYFVASWMGRNGNAGTPQGRIGYARRFTATGGSSGTRWASVVESIPAWRRRLQRVDVWSMDAFEMVERIQDAPGVAVYCDPPYMVKSKRYLYDMAEDAHARLAALLKRFRRARVVVSYYDHPRLRSLYPPYMWRHELCPMTKAMANMVKRDEEGAASAPEVLIINRTESEVAGGGRAS